MDAVSTVEGRAHQIGVRGIAHDPVEVDDAIERRLRADPLVHLVLDPGLVRIPSCVGSGGRHSVTRNDRHPDHPDAFCFYLLNRPILQRRLEQQQRSVAGGGGKVFKRE